MKIILIGTAGSGKSTQGNLLSKRFKIPYLSTGHIFREMAKEHSPLGRQIKMIMTSGLLISDEKTLKIVTEYLSRPSYKNGYILDGFPRTLGQAKAFKNGVDKVVYINVSDKEVLWRLAYRENQGREDDTLRAIRKRIEVFHRFTKPVLDYYEKKGILATINGEKPVKEVQKNILQHLGVT